MITSGNLPPANSTSGSRPQLFLVDGSSYIYRAFHGIPPLNNSAGLPTNAIFGFTNFLLKLLNQHQPGYVVVALDAGRDTFRHRLYDGYKRSRPKPPEALSPQFPYFRKVLEALKLFSLELSGYEADDIIATLCTQLAGRGCDLIVVSSDKDMMQLVAQGVKLLDTGKDRWIGAEEVQIKFGVPPDRVIEVMGLMGDAVDNIPGVKGIGAKTAATLIQQFQTLENLFDHLDEVERMNLRGAPRLRRILEQDRFNALLSRSLATVKRDVPLDVQIEALKFTGFDQAKLRHLCTELEFTAWIPLLDQGRLGPLAPDGV